MLHGRFDVVAAPEAAASGDTAPPTDAVAPRPHRPAPTTYQVMPGDTLSGIAIRQYGSVRRWRAIAAANPGIDPRRLRPGQILVLPADGE
jgi:nucleoid-associated protein YgaU